MDNGVIIIDAKTVVKWVGRIVLPLMTGYTFLMYIDALPKYDHYLLVLGLVLFGFKNSFKANEET